MTNVTLRCWAGPFTFADVAINVWAHNPAPIRLPGNGGYAIVHIGGGGTDPNGGRNCTLCLARFWNVEMCSSLDLGDCAVPTLPAMLLRVNLTC